LPVAIVLVGGVAIVGWFRPLPANKPPAVPTYTEQQAAEAKAKVCGAYQKVRNAVSVNTGRGAGDDPTSIFAVAANARIALYDGGDYLSKKLAEEPATPPDLTNAVRALVSAFQQMAIDYLANAPDPEQASSRDTVERANATVYGICK
jgi:hypothetical protein